MTSRLFLLTKCIRGNIYESEQEAPLAKVKCFLFGTVSKEKARCYNKGK